mmetsp:Transcript_31308/g.43405  ORF Transcript_31308/g.43405 Transcript_31308/m.43405 type:complete len:513 (-) Transcript_31308:155-1693(-)|eukprot:CAMPEP_0196580848 /NCGR_PEP_ID=MMETSP1081-20130531/31014_1 /TAXON_ID=36882 /ORGANISM="Pyramimonas amylifera, Strain CCMP720" /LENGTH=512 /DNA_ID=CAMNT_0041900857 /DNA_START=113 /DNA_END=1651 /DNA_ORIENTATION=+
MGRPAKKAKKIAEAELPAVVPTEEFGVFGMGTMGQNLCLNIAEKGFRVAAYNRPDEFQARIWGALERAKKEGEAAGKTILIEAFTELPAFVNSLKVPRCILLSIPSGKPVDMTLEALTPLLSPGDVILDGGNENYTNTELRSKLMLESCGVHFMGMGISGGEFGARNGPSLMPGGTLDAWNRVSEVLEAMSAKVGDENSPCVTRVGPGGSGHYVKMVHNGIEYADMQFIAEAYDIMKTIGGLTNEEMAANFRLWNEGRLQSYLFEITADILLKDDDQEDSTGYLIDKILDQSGQKGTGKWTVQEAANVGIAAPVVSAALEARFISARKDDRVKCQELYSSKVEENPCESSKPSLSSVEKEKMTVQLEQALYASKVCAYAQGFSVIQAASNEYDWNVELAELARIWRGGCIIRAKLLNEINSAYQRNPGLSSLLLDENLADPMAVASSGLRSVVQRAVAAGVAASGFCGALAYFDAIRRGRCPANMIQAQRDYFGAHTFKRSDKEGSFHAKWS